MSIVLRCLSTGLFAIALISVANARTAALPPFSAMVKQNAPAVVNIRTTSSETPSSAFLPPELRTPENEELLEEFRKRFGDFGQDEGGKGDFFSDRASGSGFIISADGYVVSNHHVVAHADSIMVRLNDRREFEAKLIGSDENSDIALLKIDATGLPTVTMGDSSQVEVGEWVLAIGSPFGFEASATAGIVSALSRSLPDDSYVPFIQTDVAINPGNSGGPLFNIDGKVIGINSQIYSRSGGFMGLSFAIPANISMHVIEQLKSHGKVSRGWIGVYIQEVDQALAKSAKLAAPRGALVSSVVQDGPAQGILLPQDIIVEFAGEKVPSAAALPAIVGITPANEEVKIRIIREGKQQALSITPGILPSREEIASRSSLSTPDEKGDSKDHDRKNLASGEMVLGMTLSEIPEKIREAMKLPPGGLLVEKVNGELAKQAGLQAGDIISMLDGHGIESVNQFRHLLKAIPKDKTLALLTHRKGKARYIALKQE